MIGGLGGWGGACCEKRNQKAESKSKTVRAPPCRQTVLFVFRFHIVFRRSADIFFQNRNRKSEIPNDEIRNHKSQIRNHESEITNQKSKITNQKSQITNQKSQIRNHKPQISKQKSQSRNHKAVITKQNSQSRNHKAQIAKQKSQAHSGRTSTLRNGMPNISSRLTTWKFPVGAPRAQPPDLR